MLQKKGSCFGMKESVAEQEELLKCTAWRKISVPLSLFNGIVYINLDYRTDRKTAFLKEMERLQVEKSKLYRIAASYDPLNGIKGCLQSHLEALDFIEKKGWERGLILEDDCFFPDNLETLKNVIKSFFQNAQSNYDVFFLGGRYLKVEETPWKNFIQIRNSRRSHAYCVRKEYIPFLVRCYQNAYKRVQKDLFFLDSIENALDLSWKELQIKDRWYAPRRSFAFQRESFSDIEYCDRCERHD